MDELIDVVDQNGKPTGETVMKHTAHKEGIRHSCAHVWILAGEKLLLQKRAPSQHHPGTWATSAAGHIAAGESPHEAGCREALEELGVALESEQIHFGFLQEANDSYPGFTNNEINHVFFAILEEVPERFTFHDGEVTDIRFFGLDELLAAVETAPDSFASHPDYIKRVVSYCKEHFMNTAHSSKKYGS